MEYKVGDNAIIKGDSIRPFHGLGKGCPVQITAIDHEGSLMGFTEYEVWCEYSNSARIVHEDDLAEPEPTYTESEAKELAEKAWDAGFDCHYSDCNCFTAKYETFDSFWQANQPK